jgi:hypothetical protein
MDISKYQYLWNEEQKDWVLVNTPYGYGIFNIRTNMMMMVSDRKLKMALLSKMEEEGNKKYDSIDDVPIINVAESC